MSISLDLLIFKGGAIRKKENALQILPKFIVVFLKIQT